MSGPVLSLPKFHADDGVARVWRAGTAGSGAVVVANPWQYGWEASSTGDSGDPPKRTHPIDVQAEINKTMARINVRDQMAPLLRYRQTTEDEAWLNQIGITGIVREE